MLRQGELHFIDKEYVDKAMQRLTAMERQLQQMVRAGLSSRPRVVCSCSLPSHLAHLCSSRQAQVYGSVLSFTRIIEEHTQFVVETHKIVGAQLL